MKTTKGKTRTPRPAGRVVHIYRLEDNKLLAVKRAATLKQALLEYANETLTKRGDKNPKVVGNVMTVVSKQGRSVQYRALEAYQSA